MRRRGASGDAPRSTKPERDRHIPVLLSEVIESLAPEDNQLFIDGTFGAGGYTRAIFASGELPRHRVRSRYHCGSRGSPDARRIFRPLAADQQAF